MVPEGLERVNETGSGVWGSTGNVAGNPFALRAPASYNGGLSPARGCVPERGYFSNDPRCFRTSNDTLLCELLNEARERVVFVVAPGASVRVAETLAATWCRLGPEAVSVVLDVDPEVYRLGYGEEGAIDVLQRCASELGQSLCEQPGVRLGLLVVDDWTLVYSPTPRLVESDEPASIGRRPPA